MREPREDIINSVDRSLELLLLLYDNQRAMGISEISEQMGIYKSTVFRTLKTLENRGFVTQNHENKTYWLGMKLYVLGMLVAEKMHIRDVVAPFTKELFDCFNEVVNVSVLEVADHDFHRCIIVQKEHDAGQILVASQPLGSSNLCYCSAVGKCLLAFTRGLDLSIYTTKPMQNFTDRTIINGQDFLKELEKVKEDGYALDQEERERGLTCIGAPIFGRDGNAIAAISISGPTSRIYENGLEQRVRKVQEIAQNISNAFR